MKMSFKKILPFLMVLFIVPFLFFNTSFVQAQEVNELMENLIEETPLIRGDLIDLIFRIIRYALGFLGVVAVVILIYGGFTWMTARGNDEKVQKAKKIITNGLIGLVIILLAYTIVSFIMGRVLDDRDDDWRRRRDGPEDFPRGASYLVITSRDPQPGETTARNTSIVVTFNQNLKEDTIRLARPDENGGTICDNYNVAVQDNQGNYLDGAISVTGRTLVFTPKGECDPPLHEPKCEKKEGWEEDCSLEFKNPFCCGCFDPGQDYTIKFIAYRDREYVGIEGTRGTTNKLQSDELWSFNVAPYLDLEAPEIEYNAPHGTRVARNVGISVIFSKSVNPFTLTLYEEGERELKDASVKIYYKEGEEKIPVKGSFEGMTSTSFVFRGQERCDDDEDSELYECKMCLPSETEIVVELDDKIKGGNCVGLDCGNDKCSWQFTTSNLVDLDPPVIREVWPEDEEKEVDRLLQIMAWFEDESGIDPTSINEDTFALFRLAYRRGNEVRPSKIETRCSQPGEHCLLDKALFTPSIILDPDTIYRPIIYGGGEPGQNACVLDPVWSWGVRDMAGNTMVSNYIWNFETGWMVNACKPHIQSINPRSGPEGTCITIEGYNLGCCLSDQCQDLWEAQKNKWDCQENICLLADREGEVQIEGKEGLGFLETEVLKWQEVNKPIGWTPTSAYSPESEMIIVVPEGAKEDRSEIRVFPAD